MYIHIERQREREREKEREREGGRGRERERERKRDRESCCGLMDLPGFGFRFRGIGAVLGLIGFGGL